MKDSKLLIIASSIVAVIIAIIIIFLFNKRTAITYEIVFETDGGTIIESQRVNKGEKVKKPNAPVKDGYTFVEWINQDTPYDFNSEVKSDLTLIAKWNKNEISKDIFVVEFDSAGGSEVESQNIESGNKVTQPDAPTRDGYVFEGWTLNNKLYNFDEAVEEDIKLVAKWKKKVTNNDNDNTVKEYKVAFDTNGGSSVSTQIIINGSKAKKPSNPKRSGYTFEGWTLNGKTYDFNSKVTKNITLVAKWKKVETNDEEDNEVVVEKYTVTFDSNGGSSVSTQTITEGDKAKKPSNPKRSGYTFVSWTLNGKTYDFNAKINKSITLVAKWKQKKYTITATPVDSYSPDRVLTVYENGKKISFKSIKYSDGVFLCSGSNPTVSDGDIVGETKFKIELNDGTMVNATLN